MPQMEMPVDGEGNAIVVTGERLRGQLDVEQAPVLELNAEDIEAIGATSIAELIEAIGPQTSSSRGRGDGRPVFLVNGIRIGSFRELRSYPPEAIEKVEVMPEEVAQKFGFPPDRRVVNIILKENYSSREIELEYEQPWDGGYSRNEQEFTLLTINDGARFNVNLEASDSSLLTEAERGVIQADDAALPAGVDLGQFRSLVSDSREYEGTVNWAKALGENGTSLSLNASAGYSETLSLSGVQDLVTLDPLERRTEVQTYSSSASLSRPIDGWQFTATADAVLQDTQTEIERAGSNLTDFADSETVTLDSKASMRGTLADLPAGELSATFNADLDWKRIASEDTRTSGDARFTRRRLGGAASIVVPIAEDGAAWGGIGDLSANFSAGIEDLSDFGTLYDWSAGLTWKPTESLTLSATHIVNEEAPSLTQLGAPRLETFNVPTFDFVNGETVLATIISGGNPDLLAETQRDWKFSANWELPFWENTRFSAEYVRNRSSDVTSSLPAVTAAIEAAFPDRITRDASGQLVSIDRRPITYDRTRSERLVFSLTTRGSFGEARPESEGEAQRGPRGGGGRSAEGRRGDTGGPGGEGRRGPPSPEQREAFMQFRERVCAEDGMAVLERLAQAVANGEDLSAQFPGFDPERAARMIERFRKDDGSIDQERLAQFRERICSMDPAAMRGQGGQNRQAAGQGGGRRGGGGPGFGRRGDDGRGRYFVNLTHTVELANTILIAPGIPELDLLDGDASGSTGQARHSARLEAGMFRNGWGVRLSGNYTGKARIDGSDALGNGDLFFGDLATFDLRVFADLGQVLEREEGFLKNFRVSLRADNVFDARRRVTDQNGEVPLGYQPFLIDPVGRYIGVDLRKLF
ncbi:TonB-dependent Receptor Plug Domain [Altererythrobacter xiamenensis]|uniref:TonB-dependent Receptor Plug Domain n=1 Tax=Altererythrobacter xiamenensis TaxID=1316679 RepID=A0A1Y6EDE6_9SPHN|nr:TonB-dependent Receptor Plug Domain [Altererythrobacter xiamenensis]